jgi:hypothetical protein
MMTDETWQHGNDPDRRWRPGVKTQRTAWLLTATFLCMAVFCPWVQAKIEDASRAADSLLQLVPPDASVVVTVEGLRDQVREIGASRLVSDLRRLPAVTSWLDSEKYRHLERSCEQVEAVLGVKLTEIRDQVLGDAVVLVLRLPPGDAPDPSRARGLLLLRARNPDLMTRLISAVNAGQQDSGELKRVDDFRRGNTTYHVREFPEGSGRPPECYVSYPDGTFAFSNSEELIHGVVDRKRADPGLGGDTATAAKPENIGTGPGLGDSPRVIAVRRRLPERPLARLYVDPRAVERLLGVTSRPPKPSDPFFLAVLRRHLASIDYAGAALVWRSDAVVVHAVETLDAARVDAWLRRWARDQRTCRSELRRVPRTALAIASIHIDFAALREAAYEIVPAAEHQRLRNFEILLTGLLLGRDPLSFLPVLGPGVIAYLDEPAGPIAEKTETPGRGGLFPLVVVVDLAAGVGGMNPQSPRGGPALEVVADALENALRTLLVVVAMDEKHGRGRAAIATSRAAGESVRTLSIPIPFAYAIDRTTGKLLVGTSPQAVARYLEGDADPEAGARFREWQAAAFPGYETFACVDLEAVTRLASQYRARLARNLAARQNRPAAEVEVDLDHVVAFAGLFRAAFVASRIEPDSTALNRCFGLIPRDAATSPTPHR